MAGTSGSNFLFSICWPLDHVLLVQRTSSSPASRRTPAAPRWWGGHDHPHALLCVLLTHAAFTHSAAGLKLRDEFEAVSDRQSQTRGEIIMHSSRTQWAYSFCDTLCLCVCVCCLSTSVTASQPPLPEAAVPHMVLHHCSHPPILSFTFCFSDLAAVFGPLILSLCLPLLFSPIHPAFPPLHCHNKASLPGAFHRALSSR